MTEARLSLGRLAEDLVARQLERDGMRLLARNVRIRYTETGIAGELDLIAIDGAALVFVEVKAALAGTRSGPERPVLAVTPRKQRRVRLLARAWLQGNRPPVHFSEVRFDVVGVRLSASDEVLDYEHLRAAF